MIMTIAYLTHFFLTDGVYEFYGSVMQFIKVNFIFTSFDFEIFCFEVTIIN